MKLTKTAFTLLGSCALITLLTGCSSIMCGPRQSVSISSKPVGAEVLVFDPRGEIVFQNSTPCVASLLRTIPEEERANYTVLIRKEGYTPVQISLTSHINAAYLANVLNGGVGLIVDSFTCSMWTLSAEGLDPKLVDESAAIIHEDHDLMIALQPQTAQDLMAHLEPIQSHPIALETVAQPVRTSGE